MSKKEYAINLLDNLSDRKLVYIINVLEDISKSEDRSDEYDLELALDSEIDNDEEYTSEEVYNILGLNL